MHHVLVGGMLHETNTFNPTPTDLAAFRAREWLEGQELVVRRRGTGSEMGGFLDVLEAAGDVALVPGVLASAMPSGRVTEEALEAVVAHLTDAASRHPVDGALLALHGALVSERHDDGEGYLLARLRDALGCGVPVVCTLDLHATLTPEMAAGADALVIYRTYPHMDQRERGREAARLLLRALRGEVRPVVAVAKRPLLIGPPQNVLPADEPMRSILARAREMERAIPGVLAACVAHGFMQQDVYHAGVGAAVTTDGDRELATRLAEELAELVFRHRGEYAVEMPTPEEAVRLARTAPRPPVAIADTGDNIGAGTPGDGTALLAQILRQGVGSAFVQLCDPQAVRLAAEAGVGATVTLDVGGKSAPVYGPPVTIAGRVRALTDGAYVNRAGMGYTPGVAANMGPSARVDCDGLTVVLTTLPMSPNNLMHARSIGVYPEDYRMTVCKGGLAFREAYRPPVARTHILADTPGYSTANLTRLDYRRVRRPIYPLDEGDPGEG